MVTPDGIRFRGFIENVDFTSLYLYVMKNRPFPVGHPVVTKGSPSHFDYSKDRYFGFMNCKITPLNDLFHPVLPFRCKTPTGMKLVFALCRSTCSHTEEERSFQGIWPTPEIYKAVEMGYDLKEIYQVWDYPSLDTNLFATFVNKFLKIKQENSGFPSSCERDEEKLQYVRDYKEHEGINGQKFLEFLLGVLG